MPEPTINPDQHLVPLDVPAWLTAAVAPFRVRTAALWRGGLMLELESERARVPVLIAASTLAMSVLDPRIPASSGAAFVRALHSRLQQAAPVRAWLQRLSTLTARLTGEGESESGGDPLQRAWQRWPTRDAAPSVQIEPLPDGEFDELPREAQAALILHRFARAEPLAALTAWEALPSAGPNPSFTELHVDAVALGLLGLRDAATSTLQAAEAQASTGEQWLALARGHEALDQRALAIAAHERVLALRGGDWDRLRLARARGGFEPGQPLPRSSPSDPVESKLSFARELVKTLDEADRHDDALMILGEVLDDLGLAAPIDLAVRAAELHLWRCEGDQARARLAAVPHANDDARAQLILAALAVLEGRPAAGLAALEAMPSDGPTQLLRLVWLAEAELALDRPERALTSVARHILLENSLVAYLVYLLARIRVDFDEVARSFDARTFLDALILDVLPTLCAAEDLAEARRSPARFAALIRGLLDDMGGNRGPRPTWRRREPSGVVRLEPLAVRPSGRDAAVANLIRIRTEPPEAVLAGFDACLDAYPNSPHPYTYRGELQIWLGRYADALASFEASDLRAPTRWAYVGRAAAYDLLGESEQADHWTSEGAQRFGEIETATTHVYRGERLRKLEDWQAARADLEIALAQKTRRIGARINLALVYRALGETQLGEQQLARLQTDAPAFVWEAGGRAGQPLDERTLLTMLDRMVGNRSSFLHTMIDADGRFRVVPEPSRWIAHARLSLATARDAIGRALARGLLGE